MHEHNYRVIKKMILLFSGELPHELDVERFTTRNTTCSNDTFVRGYGQKVTKSSRLERFFNAEETIFVFKTH
jgi:hypothetical protein